MKKPRRPPGWARGRRGWGVWLGDLLEGEHVGVDAVPDPRTRVRHHRRHEKARAAGQAAGRGTRAFMCVSGPGDWVRLGRT